MEVVVVWTFILALITAMLVSGFIFYMVGFKDGVEHQRKYPSITDKFKWISRQ